MTGRSREAGDSRTLLQAFPVPFNFSFFSPSMCANDILPCNYYELNLGCTEKPVEVLWVTVNSQLAVVTLCLSKHIKYVSVGEKSKSVPGRGILERAALAYQSVLYPIDAICT